MIFKLETPEHQKAAIQSVVEVFRGMEKNTYDNATDEDIRANYCSLSLEALMANINKIAAENGIDPLQTYFQESRNACIEMETGTGKTLTYLQSAYELYKEYGLTKFIVLVPSIPIRQGVIDTFEIFKTQLEDRYDFTHNAFVYDSSKLSDLRDFITSRVYKATDGIKTAYITVDSNLYDETVVFFMSHPDTKFICIERALDTTKKFNLKNKMQDKFLAF